MVVLLKSWKNKGTFTKHSTLQITTNFPLQTKIYLKFSENISPLENGDKLSSEGIVTQVECLKALKDFKNEKSPGTDGLQAEFYKYFWKEMHPDMIRSFNFAFDNGSLSISQRRGTITLIAKANKDTTLLDNLRPTSLRAQHQL